MSNRIQFVETRESRVLVPLPDAWEVKKFKCKWMSLAVRWIFSALGDSARKEDIAYTYHVIDPDSFMQSLFDQHRALLRMHYKPSRVLIGSEDFAKLMNTKEVRERRQFIAEYESSDGRNRTIHGLQVQIIPWMRGILVMP